MKKFILFVIAGLMISLTSNSYAYTGNVEVICNTPLKDCSVGETLFFVTGQYRISVLDGSVGTQTLGGQNFSNTDPTLGWFWGMNISQPSMSSDFILGSYAFGGRNDLTDRIYFSGDSGIPDENAAKAAALGASFGGFIDISVTNPVGEDITFFINDTNPRDNVGSLTVSVSVVPEPISSLLFVVGGMTLAARYYSRRKTVSIR